MTSFKFKCRAVDIEHICKHNKEKEPVHPPKLLAAIKEIISIVDGIQFQGEINSPANNYQISVVNFDNSWMRQIEDVGWKKVSFNNFDCIGEIPNIQPDGILMKKGISLAIEFEKSNKKTIWFDLIKFMMLISQKIADYGLLVVPKNYAHKLGVWNLFYEARYYRYCLSKFAKVDKILLSKVAIIGYIHESYVSGRWSRMSSDIVNMIKKEAAGKIGRNRKQNKTEIMAQ